MPDGLAHPPHLTVSPLVEHELHPRAAELAGAGGSSHAVLELDTFRENRNGGGGQVALDVCDIGLLDAVAWMGQTVRQIAVVRQQQHAARVDVEPAHRYNARLVADDVDDGRSALGITGRRYHPERLVQEDVGELLLADPITVHLDDVGRRDERVELTPFAVHRNAPGLDQLIRGTT